MQGKGYSEGQEIHSSNSPNVISLIAEGEVEGVFGSLTFAFGKSDVIGVCDFLTGRDYITYTAVSDVNLYEYHCPNIRGLGALIHSNADIAYLMVNGVCKQIAELFMHRERLVREGASALTLVKDSYDEYTRLCKEYSVPSKKIPGINDLAPFSGEDPIEDWVHDFYVEIGTLEPALRKAFFHQNAGIVLGFLKRCNNDLINIVEVCSSYHDYVSNVSSFLLGEDGFDLFALVCELHLNLLHIEAADSAVGALVTQISDALSTLTGVNSITYNNRLYAYWDELEERREAGFENDLLDELPTMQRGGDILTGALETILEYSGADDTLSETFSRCIKAYTEFPDRNSSDDDVYDTRRDLTKSFYKIYKLVFIKSLSDTSIPTIINMFLNFGFVDPILAGSENAEYLYSIADSYKGTPEKGIFTIREWLAAIYRGEKEPSLSEFDMDYATYLRDLKKTKQIDKKEEARLLADQDEKLRYEMENAFPVVNRVTFGNPTRFCPVFADHNVQRDLEKTLVSASAIEEILNNIRSIDFSAFYRETGFSDQKLGISGESIHVEVLPNIILTPNVGTRGSMWQEIEGRIRTTPARMFLPIFLENDLSPTLIKLVADFRWEICKRVQGSRWNDMTDPSLTSYFCDYLQFYMNNSSLAMQTMTEIRNELSVARDNYKAVFISNYLLWIQNESKGMARLNSVALDILMTFCPFSAEIREKLKNNMRYNKALSKLSAKKHKRSQRLTLVVNKLSQNGKKIPQELLDELEFSRR